MWPFSALFGTPRWKVIAQEKQDARARAVDEGLVLAGPVTSRDSLFLSASACEIAERIRNGEWKSGEVVRAFVRRAAQAQEKTNCLTEVRFAAAIREADALDASSAPKTGRLCGVPVSVKDQFDLAGYDTSVGFSSWSHKPAKEDAVLVQLMKEEGAIVLAKTNIPQTLLAFESTNPIFGRTSNPWNKDRACGGSSGGEAALLACDGSALGIGSDIGGSLRIPVFWCGIYSLKPTAHRVPTVGLISTKPGFDAIKTVTGPMGRTLADVRLLSEISIGSIPRNSSGLDPLPPVPFRTELASIPAGTRLRLGYYQTDGVTHASPAVQRAVQTTVDALRVAGHELVLLDANEIDMMGCMEVFVGLTSCDGYRGMLAHVKRGGEPVIKELFLTTLSPKLPGFVRRFAAWLATRIMGDTHFSRNMSASRIKSVPEMYEYLHKRDEYQKYWAREVWDKHGLDGIIAPQMAIPPPEHGRTALVPQISAATFLYNVLDYPTGVLPVLHVDPKVDSLADHPLPPKVGHGNGTMVERPLYVDRNPIYDAVGMAGLPVGIQIVGRRWEDEKVLGMMEVVESALKAEGGERFGPGRWKA